MAFETSQASPRQATVFFERRELIRLFSLYGRMVSAGEWRDYAIDGLSESAVFSVFKRASEAPLYRIEKRPALARRQGPWAVLGQGEMVRGAATTSSRSFGSSIAAGSRWSTNPKKSPGGFPPGLCRLEIAESP